jgi:sulfur transfer protein SufE
MTIDTNSSPIEFNCRNLHAEHITDVLTTKPNLLSRLGLAEALGIVRMHGRNAILYRIDRRWERQAKEHHTSTNHDPAVR